VLGVIALIERSFTRLDRKGRNNRKHDKWTKPCLATSKVLIKRKHPSLDSLDDILKCGTKPLF
jgi:hypothetical protein